LIAGAEIMTALATCLQLEGKTLVFDRNSITAWLRAALDTSLNLPAPQDAREAANVSQEAAPPVGEKAQTAEKPRTAEPPAPKVQSPPVRVPVAPKKFLPFPQSPPPCGAAARPRIGF
jgi:hypothetical protein